jgi:hypothetical protein
MWKNRFKSIIFILTMWIVGLVIGVKLKKTYVENSFKPYHWESPPVIVNCIGEEIFESTIINAIEYWSKNGHEILFYEYKMIQSMCEKEKEYEGFIILRKENEQFEPGVVARTYRYTNGYFQIKTAVIYFKEDSYNYYLLLEHEMGHAFGYSHRKILGHVMNPYYDYMGPVFW